MIEIDELMLERIRRMLKICAELQRGCDCEYDYRCGNCESVIELRELAAGIEL